jgi:uncharacterized protein YjbI with pentapeptide repeats
LASVAELKNRWTRTSLGQQRAGAALRHLLRAAELPSAFPTYEGRADFRGLNVISATLADQASAHGLVVGVLSRYETLRSQRWQSIDLSHAAIGSMRFHDAEIEDCVFDRADCDDWRLWDTAISDSSFVGTKLRSGALGTWDDGRSNRWSRTVFDKADMRGASFLGGALLGCSFRETKLTGAEFLQVEIRDVVFAGRLVEVLFDGRDIPGRRPAPSPLANVDFSAAMFEDVEFRGCRFQHVTLPSAVRMIPNYPATARKALELLQRHNTDDASAYAAELRNSLKLPGAEGTSSVYNRADYVVFGGEALADLVEAVLDQAAREL